MNNNLYTASLLLPPGRYEYRFIVDGKWCNGGCKEQVSNPFGTMNNVLVVSPQKNNETTGGLADTFSRLHDNEKDVFWNSPI